MNNNNTLIRPGFDYSKGLSAIDDVIAAARSLPEQWHAATASLKIRTFKNIIIFIDQTNSGRAANYRKG